MGRRMGEHSVSHMPQIRRSTLLITEIMEAEVVEIMEAYSSKRISRRNLRSIDVEISEASKWKCRKHQSGSLVSIKVKMSEASTWRCRKYRHQSLGSIVAEMSETWSSKSLKHSRRNLESIVVNNNGIRRVVECL